MNICIYNKTTGHINRGFSGPTNFIANQLEEGEDYIEGLYSYNKYFDVLTEELKYKQELPINVNKMLILADGTDEWVVSGLPEGTKVTWPDDEITEVNDGEIIFTVDVLGIYNFTIESFPYLKKEIFIEAVI